jgi:hypothetical protein
LVTTKELRWLLKAGKPSPALKAATLLGPLDGSTKQSIVPGLPVWRASTMSSAGKFADGGTFVVSIYRGKPKTVRDPVLDDILATKRVDRHAVIERGVRRFKEIDQAVRSFSEKMIGSGAVVMQLPLPVASHIIVVLWSEVPGGITDQDLAEAIVGAIETADQKAETKASEIPLPEEPSHDTTFESALDRLTEFEHDALMVVKEGNQKRYWDKYKDTFELLAVRGFLVKVGTLSVRYELTDKGKKHLRVT